MRKASIPTLKAFTVGDQTVDIDALLKAPFDDISEASDKLPSLIGWFGYHKGKASERVVNTKYRLKEAEAKAYFDLRNGGFVSQGFGDKITETALERAVILCPEVKAASEAYARAEKDYDWIVATIKAFESKLEIIRSIEATRRKESEVDNQSA